MAHILIVDDEADVLETLKFCLEEAGHSCSVASNGLEALEKARGTSPDLIILDVMLPRMDGFHVSRLLKFDARYRRIPIILLTARAGVEDRKVGGETGADVYMVKPFEMSELLALVGRLLGHPGVRGDA